MKAQNSTIIIHNIITLINNYDSLEILGWQFFGGEKG